MLLEKQTIAGDEFASVFRVILCWSDIDAAVTFVLIEPTDGKTILRARVSAE